MTMRIEVRIVLTMVVAKVSFHTRGGSEATCVKFAHVQIEGGREVARTIEYYNLDVIISVGCRGKSLRGTQFPNLGDSNFARTSGARFHDRINDHHLIQANNKAVQ